MIFAVTAAVPLAGVWGSDSPPTTNVRGLGIVAIEPHTTARRGKSERPHITIVRHGLAISTGSGSIRSEALTSIGMVRHFALEGKSPF